MDEVVNDLMTKYCMLLHRLTGRSYSVSDFKEYDVTKTLPEELHELGIELFKKKELWDVVVPIPEAQVYIKRLIDDGHDVYFATAAEPCTVGWKEEWIKRHMPYFKYKNMIVIHDKHLLDVDVLVDDYIENLKYGKYRGVLYTRPWNVNVETDESNIKRANNWDSVYNIISKMEPRKDSRHQCNHEVSVRCFNGCIFLDDDDGGAICRAIYSNS